MEQIENQLLALVKGCINDRDFVINTTETKQTRYNGHGKFTNIHTGVEICGSHDIINKTYLNGETYPSRSETRYFKTIRLTFENEPSIVIFPEVLEETKKISNVTEKIVIEGKTLKEKFFNLFKPFSYIKENVEEIITYTHGYKLTCGDFNISVSDEEVEELIKLYETNLVKFRKISQAIEIEKRIKKYVK